MGLDTVELVMAFEEEFQVEIPDDEAEWIITVGDARDYIVRKLRERAEDPDAVDPEEIREHHTVIEKYLGEGHV